MTNAHSFPLLKLPNKEQIRVLRNMADYSILYFSLISKNAKALIKSVGLKTEPVFLSTEHRTDEDSIRMLCRPENVELLINRVHSHYINFDMEFKDWIDHVLFIFNQQKINYIWFDIGYERFDLEAIKKSIPFQGRLQIDRKLDDASANTIFNAYPHTDGLIIERNIFVGNQLKWLKLFVENFETLDLGADEASFEPMDLNSLLACNAKNIVMENCILSGKESNCFLKLWIKGANPRMEYSCFAFSRRTIPMEAIIKGLKCEDVNTAEKLEFKNRFYDTRPFNRTVAMFDIYRYDGIKGTIVFRDDDGIVLDFLVYHN